MRVGYSAITSLIPVGSTLQPVFLCLFPQSYNDQVEAKSPQTSQPSHMMPPKQPLYSVPPQASSSYLGPGSFPLSDLQSYAGPQRHSLSRPLSQSQMLPSISASPPTTFQISPPLHQQLSLHQSSILNQPIRMQQVQSQPIISHQMGLQASLHSPPPGQQVGCILLPFILLDGIFMLKCLVC